MVKESWSLMGPFFLGRAIAPNNLSPVTPRSHGDVEMPKDQINDRASIANDVWNTDEISLGNSSSQVEKIEPIENPSDVEDVEKKEIADVDPWAGIPLAVKEEIEGLRSKVSIYEGIEGRLKQAEKRIGSFESEIHASREAAKALKNAPSKEQIAEAAASQADWDALKEDFPEWTKATESKIAAERAEILKHIPDVNSIREELKTSSIEELGNFKREMSEMYVALKHPDWKTTRDSADFKKWNESQGNKDSSNPIEVIAILDDYAKYQSTKKTPKQIAAEREERLEAAQTKPGHKLPPTKSEADMTPSEIRAAVAKQVWQ